MAKNAIVYLDGYNFYYGCLRQTSYKWLDLVTLFKNILYIQDPEINLIKVNYFTSSALARYARNGAASEKAQTSYHNALKQLYKPRRFEIILGSHELKQVELPKATKGNNIIDKNITERVWRSVEKKTDIQIAIEMYADVAHNACDIIILCTNDTDLEPALKRIRTDFPEMEIGFIAAVPTPKNGTPEGRQANKSLKALANWTRHSIAAAELATAQMPPVINTRKGVVNKPSHW
jgi:uncharacterized LabA/DUF88 family protein